MLKLLSIATLSSTALASTAHAQWTITNLHPAGAFDSGAMGIAPSPSGLQQVGYATINNATHAALWRSSAATFVDLHPAAGYSSSIALATSQGRQVGSTTTSAGFPFAASWTSTAASYQNVSPAAASDARAISGNYIGGLLFGGTTTTACYWNQGTRTNLSGAGVNAVDNTTFAGYYRTGSFPLFSSGAALWTLTSFIDLAPAGSGGSSCNGVSGNQQVGRVIMGSQLNPNHAALWTGSAASFIDLHPAGATSSECHAVHGGIQVGYVKMIDPNDPNMNSIDRAALWTGTAQSFVNLHNLLTGYQTSVARAVYTDAQHIYIAGFGFNTANNRTEALLWTYTTPPSCGSSDFNGDGDFGTDADIEAFFACLAGQCCPTCFSGGSDFNGDGDYGTDADIESFFRVLGGGNC